MTYNPSELSLHTCVRAWAGILYRRAVGPFMTLNFAQSFHVIFCFAISNPVFAEFDNTSSFVGDTAHLILHMHTLLRGGHANVRLS
jgi:hypothetical protein